MPQQTQASQWRCGCGAMNTGKFCSNCGQPMPSQTTIHCDKCGWTPPANTQAPKFCPNCGDVIDQRDMS